GADRVYGARQRWRDRGGNYGPVHSAVGRPDESGEGTSAYSVNCRTAIRIDCSQGEWARTTHANCVPALTLIITSVEPHASISKRVHRVAGRRIYLCEKPKPGPARVREGSTAGRADVYASGNAGRDHADV